MVRQQVSRRHLTFTALSGDSVCLQPGGGLEFRGFAL